MPHFFLCFAVQKAAAVRRKRLLPQAFCSHSIQHEGTTAPSYSPLCETERFFSKQKFFDKLRLPLLAGAFFCPGEVYILPKPRRRRGRK